MGTCADQKWDMLPLPDAAKGMRTQHVDCPCWKTETFIWTPGCVFHPVQDPWAYRYKGMLKIYEDAKRGIFPKTQRRGDYTVAHN
jgi:hypothetical protein